MWLPTLRRSPERLPSSCLSKAPAHPSGEAGVLLCALVAVITRHWSSH